MFNIHKVSLKLEELEEIKMAHLSKFVKKSREELRVLWDKCYFTETQRRAFTPLHSTDYNEKLLDEHENKVEELNHFLAQNSELFSKVTTKMSFKLRKGI